MVEKEQPGETIPTLKAEEEFENEERGLKIIQSNH